MPVARYLSIVTVERLMVLDYLKHKGWTRFGDIWKSGIVRKQGAVRIVNSLHKQGFMSWKKGGKYNITNRGKQYLKTFDHLT